MRKSARRVLKRLLTKTGYQLVSNGTDWEQAALCTHLSTLFRTREVDCVFDIGANRGGFGHFMRNDIGYDGMIMSFEPVSHVAEDLLVASTADPLWHVFQVAIGDVAGVKPIKVTRSDSLSSFLKPSSAAPDLFLVHISVDHEEDVQVRTLADVYLELQEAHGFRRPFLKIDTQGFDLQVIHGAGEQLAHFAAMQTELSVIPIYEEQAPYQQVLDELRGEGFAITGIYPVIRDSLLRVVEFDCVLVNEAQPSLDQA